jgi:hypothetical protein
VIAITSVDGRTIEWSVTLPGSSNAHRRTAAMAMAALPDAGYWQLGGAGKIIKQRETGNRMIGWGLHF